MLLPKFNYHEPVSLEEACELKARYKESSRLFAGGTDLMVHLKKGLASPDNIISLGRVSALASLEETKGVVSIGSCVTVTDLTQSQVIKPACI